MVHLLRTIGQDQKFGDIYRLDGATSRDAQMLTIRAAKDDVTSAVMQPLNTQAIGNALQCFNTPVTKIFSHFSQTFISSCHDASSSEK
jgi:hypothetical protein